MPDCLIILVVTINYHMRRVLTINDFYDWTEPTNSNDVVLVKLISIKRKGKVVYERHLVQDKVAVPKNQDISTVRPPLGEHILVERYSV